MESITILSEDELKRLCRIITARNIKQCFQRNPVEFARIRPGQRPNTISDEEAISLASRQVKQDFLFKYITDQTETMISCIQNNADLDVHSLDDPLKAIAYAIYNSPFSEEPDLFFTLMGKTYDVEEIARIKQYHSVFKEENIVKKDAEVIDIKDEAEEGKREKMQTDYESQIGQLQEEIQSLTAQLSEAMAKEEERKLEEEKRKNNEQSILSKYDDSQIAADFSMGGYDYISICEVSRENLGQIWLERLADIDRNGYIGRFTCNEEQPRIFGNRTRLYYKDGPDEEGVVGVWNWNVIPNRNDPTKDYVESAYNNRIEPIEIILIQEIGSIQELLSTLKTGIMIKTFPGRKIIAFYLSKGQYAGIGCNTADFEVIDSTNQIQRLKSNVFTLPEYEFNGKNIVNLANGKILYRYLSIGLPSGIISVKDPIEIVKEVILSRTTWNVYKQAGGTRTEWKLVRDFLSQIDISSVIEEISATCLCSDEEAEIYYKDFISKIDQYIDGGAIEDSIVSAVISKDPALQSRCKTLLTDEWRSENAALFEDARKELAEIQEQTQGQRKEYEAQTSLLMKETQRLQDQQAALSAQIEEALGVLKNKEKMAEDVERSVQERIHKAQQDAADFIAAMAFVSPVSKATVIDQTTSIQTNTQYTL